MMNLRAIWALLKETFLAWSQDKASRLAAALSYYMIFSIAPLLIIVIAIAGAVYGEDAAKGAIEKQLHGLVGGAAAEVIQTAIQNASQPHAGTIASIISVIVLLFGATGVFVELQDALNTIWGVKPKPERGVRNILRQRVLSFAMVLVIGFLLLVSLIGSAILQAVITYFSHVLPGINLIWHLVNFVLGFAITTLLFGLIFKVLPDVKITWSDVFTGAVLTSLLFSIGRYFLGKYLANSSFGSAYGAAGSVVVVLGWVYYAAQILFFGAEFTQVYARKYGSQIVPDKNAIPLDDRERTQQGMKPNRHKQTRTQKSPASWISRLVRSLTKSKRLKRKRKDRNR